jgi:hypothetical protein
MGRVPRPLPGLPFPDASFIIGRNCLRASTTFTRGAAGRTLLRKLKSVLRLRIQELLQTA